MAAPSFGVEEEFLLVDPRTGQPMPVGPEVAEHARGRGLDLQLELTTCQVETATDKAQSSSQLREDLSQLRSAAAQSASAAGAMLLAVGVPPSAWDTAPVTATERYRRIAERYGMVAYEQCICGCHVHVEVPNRDAAVQVSNWMRPWLPMLLALTANSAVHRDTDTGYASWRSLLWGRWPSAGPPPYFDSVAHYDSVIAMLRDSGAILDEGMVYWDVRPSSKFPTVEVRVADVPATVAETVLLATLTRAAVMTALESYERGAEAPRIDDHTLRAAYWKAAHDGLGGQAIDVFDGWATAPAARVLGEFLTVLRPALEELGEGRVDAEAGRLLTEGNGAMRQRAIWQRRGRAADVIAAAATATLR